MAAGGVKLVAATILLMAGAAIVSPRAAPVLDYEFFKARVEPIFLEKRAGHTRCYVCHAESNNGFRLERLSPGATFWSEEQSRRNFEIASRLVNPGDPASSRSRPRPAAMSSTPVAASLRPRTSRAGRRSPTGSTDRSCKGGGTTCRHFACGFC